MRRSELLLSRKFLIGILFWTTTLICGTESLRGSAVILQAKTKLAEAKAAEANSDDETNNNGSITTTSNVTKPLLTGIPQIDYIHDPNLPRELNGHNLTDYPFYNAIPEEIDFKCDGLHDGFYASVPHKCQVYHHCLFGTRYDFLCANYTAFDQKTFICHFVSEVDCDNSPKYYKRNEALYKEASTTSTTTTTTSAPSTTTAAAAVGSQPQPVPSGGGGGMRHGSAGGRRRRPYYRRRRPMYEYYYDDEEYADSDYYDEELPSPSHRRSPSRKQNKDNHGESQDFDSDYDASHPDLVKPSVRTPSASTTVYNRPRQAPKIRRPVPKNERDKYDYAVGSKSSTVAPTISEKSTTAQSPASKKHSTQSPADDEYYDEEEEEYEYDEPKNVKSKHQPDYDSPSGYEETRRSASRHRSRMPVRKRTGIYDDYDVKERPRVNRRKELYNTRYDNDRPRNIRPSMHRMKDYRPGGHKKSVDHRRRPDNAKRPSYDDYYYYDEEEEEEPMPPKRVHQRPSVEKAKSGKSKPESNERVEPKPQAEVKTKHAYSEPTYQRTPKTNNDWEEHETPKENEIPTTEHSNGDISLSSAVGGSNSGAFRSTQPYKIVKIINNVFKDVDQNIDPVSTEETRAAVVTQPKPALSAISSKAQPFRLEPKKPSSPFDELQNKTTITTTRHFVFTTPVRKPSHFAGGFFATAPETVNKLPERKQPSSPPPLSAAPAPPSPYYKTSSQYVKIPSTVVSAPRANQNSTSNGYRGANFASYFVPVVEQQRKVKPVEEQVSENLNAIGYSQSFEGGAAKPQQSQQYRQEHRLYSLPGSDRLYTNSISFSHQPPSNYDITAPGPSAPAEESATNNGDKKYSELPAYTANADYDVTFNDALQPSTLHPVRRVPSTMFYVQNQQPRRATSSDYGPYADNASFSSLNRSQNRYKRGEKSK